jgi:mycothiol synthase
MEETVLVAEKDGDIVGCLNMVPEMGVKRAVIYCVVHQHYRRHGIATLLFDKATRWLIDMGVALAHVEILKSNAVASSLLSKAEFKPVHQHIHMQQIIDVKPTEIVSPDIVIRHLAQNEETVLTDLQNLAFAQHWGYNPNTVGEITYHLKQGNGSYQNVILACIDNKPVGYCWTTPEPRTNLATGKKCGSILMLGVDPDYQNKGIGRAVLIAGMSSLFDRGIEVVEITADSVNEKAISLYKAVGFKQQAVSQCYEKDLT